MVLMNELVNYYFVISCVNMWLMSFLISCVFVSCFAHGWWFVCWPCACVFVLCVRCALMTIVLTPPILLPDYWLIFPTCVYLVSLICSLYYLIVFAVLCQFVIVSPSHVSCRVVSCRVVSCRVVSCRVVSCRVVSCRVVSCLAKLASCPVFPLWGSFIFFVFCFF